MTHVYDTKFAFNEFNLHGEYQLHTRLANAGCVLETVFDVGANIGEWKRMVALMQPDAKFHLFEPMPSTFHNLVLNDVIDKRTYVNSFGLSNSTQNLTFKYSADNDRLTTAVTDLYRDNEEYFSLLMTTGDDYCLSRRINKIEYLKIDTEGWEYKVLEGFRMMLDHRLIGIIQFEYGYANVLTKDLLIDFYKMLTPLGYKIGRLTPEGVQFKDYNLLDEDFRGPDYVAVLSDLTAAIDAISAT